MDSVSVGVLIYFISTILAVLWPYVNVYLNENQSFDYKKALAKILGALGGAVVIVIVPDFSKALAVLSEQYSDYQYLYWLAVAVLAFGSTGVGHNVGKTASTLKNKYF